MKKIKLGKHEVEIYDSIDEMPMRRFHKYNKMLLLDAGLGSDLNDIDKHLQRAALYIRERNNEDAAKELDNLRQTIYLIQSGLSPQHLAFAALVRSIDGAECTDLSDDGLKSIIEQLGDAPLKDVTSASAGAKKKLDDELASYFPGLFDDANVKEYYDKLKRRTLLILEGVIQGETDERTERIGRISTELLKYSRPKSFGGTDNAEVLYDKQFDKMCLIIAQNLNVNPKDYTILEYYNAFELIKEQAKASKKARRPK